MIELEPVKMCQVELDLDEWDKLTDGDSIARWEKLEEIASMASNDSCDYVFYLADWNIENLERVGILTAKVLDIMKYAKSQGYDYIKLYG
jgi:hypothetical protein